MSRGHPLETHLALGKQVTGLRGVAFVLPPFHARAHRHGSLSFGISMTSGGSAFVTSRHHVPAAGIVICGWSKRAWRGCRAAGGRPFGTGQGLPKKAIRGRRPFWQRARKNRSIVRRPLVVRLASFLRPLTRTGAGARLLPQRLDLTTQRRDFFRQLQHRLVLLRDVPLEVGDLFFEPSKAFVQWRAWAWRPRPSSAPARVPPRADNSPGIPNG